MAIKKSELYSTLWKCCDELRGGMDASQYKDYVLVILFVKYISDKSRNDLNFMIDIPRRLPLRGFCRFERPCQYRRRDEQENGGFVRS